MRLNLLGKMGNSGSIRLGTDLILILLPVLWVCGPLLWQDRQLTFRDAAHYYGPLYAWQAEAWEAGRWPLWSEQEGVGMPVAADPTSATFYPLKLVYRLPISIQRRHGWYLACHLALALGGMVLLGRSWRFTWAGQYLSAYAFALGGSVLFQANNVVFLVGAAWLPWAVLSGDRLLCRRSAWECTWLSICLALMVLGGDPQMAVHAVLVVGLGIFLRPTNSRRAARPHRSTVRSEPNGPSLNSTVSRRQAMFRLVLACILGGLLSAVQVLPAWRLSHASTRTSTTAPVNLYQWLRSPDANWQAMLQPRKQEDHASTIYDFSIGPWRWAELIWPNLSGRFMPTNQRWIQALPAEGRVWAPSLFMGWMPALLAWGTLCWRRQSCHNTSCPQRGRVRWLTWIMTLAALASLGRYGLGWFLAEWLHALGWDSHWLDASQPVGGLYWLIVTWVPGYGAFRYPAKCWTVAAWALASLCGWRISQLDRPMPQLRKGLLVLGSLSLLVGIWLTLNRAYWQERLSAMPADSLFGPFDVEGAWRQTCVVLFVTGCCLLAYRGFLVTRSGHLRAWPLVAATLIELLLCVSHHGLLPSTPLEAEAERASPIADWLEGQGQPKSQRVYRLPDRSWGPNEWLHSASDERLTERFHWDTQTLYPRHHLATQWKLLRSFSSLPHAEWRAVMNSLSGDELESRDCSAELRMLGVQWVLGPADLVPRGLDLAQHWPELNASLWQCPAPSARAWPVKETEFECEVLLDQGERLSLRVRSPHDSMWVVTDLYASGWRATLESGMGSRPIEIHRVRGVLRGLELPAGEHVVRFTYEPGEWKWGLRCSVVTWTLLIVTGGVGWLRRHSARHSARRRDRGQSAD